MKIKLIVIFLISFITVSSQNMLSREIALDELQKVFPEVELNLNKPQNKFVAGKQINERAIIFITGAALTTLSTVQMIRAKNSHFRFDNPKGAIPIGPHGMLFGVGLFTMSFSFVIS